MSTYTQLFYVDIIICPCPNTDDGLANTCRLKVPLYYLVYLIKADKHIITRFDAGVRLKSQDTQ